MRYYRSNSSIPRFLRDYARPVENPVVAHAKYNGGFAPDEDPADYIRINTRAIYVV
jgi:hypothetical protein